MTLSGAMARWDVSAADLGTGRSTDEVRRRYAALAASGAS
jgi:hypothetical protein